MYDCSFITKKKVRTIVEYWVYIKDTPGAYKSNYKKLFKEPAPK